MWNINVGATKYGSFYCHHEKEFYYSYIKE